MSVTNILSQYVNGIDHAPVDTPVPIVHGAVLFQNSKPWVDWMESVSNASRAVSVTAVVNFGTVGAQSFASELIQYSTDLFNSMSDYVVVRSPSAGGGLVFFARQVLASKLQVYCVNYTGAGVTPGNLDMDFLIIPKKG